MWGGAGGVRERRSLLPPLLGGLMRPPRINSDPDPVGGGEEEGPGSRRTGEPPGGPRSVDSAPSRSAEPVGPLPREAAPAGAGLMRLWLAPAQVRREGLRFYF